MAFYKRDGHVVELQTGSTVSRAEEACSPPHYQQHSIPYVTLVSEYTTFSTTLQAGFLRSFIRPG